MCRGCAQDFFLYFMSYWALVDTILKFEKNNQCIIDIPEIWSLASQNCLQEPRVQHVFFAAQLFCKWLWHRDKNAPARVFRAQHTSAHGRHPWRTWRTRRWIFLKPTLPSRSPDRRQGRWGYVGRNIVTFFIIQVTFSFAVMDEGVNLVGFARMDGCAVS